MKTQQCRVKRTYPAVLVMKPKKPQVVFNRISETEFTVNGYTVFVYMSGAWVSNPPINNPFLKNEVNQYINKHF